MSFHNWYMLGFANFAHFSAGFFKRISQDPLLGFFRYDMIPKPISPRGTINPLQNILKLQSKWLPHHACLHQSLRLLVTGRATKWLERGGATSSYLFQGVKKWTKNICSLVVIKGFNPYCRERVQITLCKKILKEFRGGGRGHVASVLLVMPRTLWQEGDVNHVVFTKENGP